MCLNEEESYTDNEQNGFLDSHFYVLWSLIMNISVSILNKTLSITVLTILARTNAASAAQLYGLQAPEIQTQIDALNTNYKLNIDVVVLNAGDQCADEQGFATCFKKRNELGSQIVFVLNLTQRRIESLVKDSLQQVVTAEDLKTFEEQIVDALRADNIPGALSTYLRALWDHIQDQCIQRSVSPCQLDELVAATAQYLAEQKQQDADNLAATTSRIVRWVAIGLIIVISAYLGRYQYLYSLDLKRVKDLHKQLSVLILSIKHNTNLFAEDKKQLQHDLKQLLTKVEDALSLSKSTRHASLKSHSKDSIKHLWTDAHHIMTSYTKMMDTISKTDDIAKMKQQIHQVDL